MTATDYDSRVDAFLARPENLPIALEIERRVPSLRQRIIMGFFRNVQGLLSAASKEWNVKVDEATGFLAKSWGVSLLLPGASDALHIYGRIEHETHEVYFGLRWNVDSEPSIALPSLKPLHAVKGDWWRNEKKWDSWVLYTHPYIDINQDRNLVRAASGALAEQVADDFLTLLKGVREPLQKINLELAASGESA